MFYGKEIVQLEMKNISQGLTEAEVERIEVLYRNRLIIKRILQAIGLIIFIFGLVLLEPGTLESEPLIHDLREDGITFLLVGFLIAWWGTAIPMRMGLKRDARVSIAESEARKRRYRREGEPTTGAQVKAALGDLAQGVGEILLKSAVAGAEANAKLRNRHIKAILPIIIYERIQRGEMTADQRAEYITVNGAYLVDIEKQLVAWRNNNFSVVTAFKKAEENGTISKDSPVDVAELQGRVNEVIKELWEDLQAAKRTIGSGGAEIETRERMLAEMEREAEVEEVTQAFLDKAEARFAERFSEERSNELRRNLERRLQEKGLLKDEEY